MEIEEFPGLHVEQGPDGKLVLPQELVRALRCARGEHDTDCAVQDVTGESSVLFYWGRRDAYHTHHEMEVRVCRYCKCLYWDKRR